jgi:selenocysteine lyase/cysteine desulfurase
VEALRKEEFPWSRETTYLDHASIGPLPERTRRAVEEFSHKRARPYLLQHGDTFGAFGRARELCARLINAEVEEIGLATNTTFGLSVAARGLPFRSGDIVLVSDREFPANVYPWLALRNLDVTCEVVPVTAQGWPDEERLHARLTDPKVRAIAVSLTQFATGYTIDLPRLSTATRQLGKWLVLDAIQGIGQMPLDVRKTPVDVLACGAQKWLLSPWGSGFVYVRRELIEQLTPAMTGWMAYEGTDDLCRLTRYNPLLRGTARRYEMVTLPFQDFFAMNESLNLLLSLGIENIERHLRGLHAPVVEWAERRGVPVASPTGPRGSAIISVTPPNLSASHHALREAGIYCSLREGVIRLSPHCYNTVEEMARVAEVLERCGREDVGRRT